MICPDGFTTHTWPTLESWRDARKTTGATDDGDEDEGLGNINDVKQPLRQVCEGAAFLAEGSSRQGDGA